MDQGLLFGRFLFKPVIDTVARQYKKVIHKVIDGSEGVSFLPDLHKYILYYFVGLGIIFEKDHGDVEDLRGIVMVKLRISGLIAAGYAY